MKFNKRTLAIIGGVALGMALLVMVIGIPVSKQTGNKHQNAISAAYDKDRAKLGACIDISLIAAGYTQQQSRAMQDALIAAGGGDGLMGGKATAAGFSTIIVQTYPDLKPFEEAFKRGFNESAGCRRDFTQLQDTLIELVELFRNWRDNPFTPAEWFGDYPNNKLEVKNSQNKFVYGQEAWALVTTIITNSGANKAYDNGGNYDPPPPFGPGSGTSPTPTPGASAPTPNVPVATPSR